MTSVRVLDGLPPSFAWDGRRIVDASMLAPPGPAPAGLRGAVAVVLTGDGVDRVLRDPLGLNKLFWARERDGGIAVAARPQLLVEAGHAMEDVWAVPRGCVVDLAPGEPAAARSLVPQAWSADAGGSRSPGAVARSVVDAIEAYLDALAGAHGDATAFVCLSGGLDSTGIAVLAKQAFDDVVAVSFDLLHRGGTSEDREVARRLARDLSLPLLEIDVEPDELLEHLDTVLEHGIDWRDFNVHAGLVNAALGQGIRAEVDGRPDRGAGDRALVLTGDLANEFLVDYHPERYGGATYYELPRVAPGRLRAGLVRGLDSSNRETGVFGAWDLPVVQPYAVAVDHYMQLDPAFLERADAKASLAREIFGDRVPEYVYVRPKARAQLGGSGAEGGVLGLCVDRGIDSMWMRKRFAALHGVEDLAWLDRFVRAGVYRSRTPSLPGAGDGSS